LRRAHLDDFVECFAPGRPRSDRIGPEWFRALPYDELIARDEASLGITWPRDVSFEDLDNLPAP
jgi:type I restriction enzyme M protein